MSYEEESWVGKLCMSIVLAGVLGVIFGGAAVLISIAKWIWCL